MIIYTFSTMWFSMYLCNMLIHKYLKSSTHNYQSCKTAHKPHLPIKNMNIQIGIEFYKNCDLDPAFTSINYSKRSSNPSFKLLPVHMSLLICRLFSHERCSTNILFLLFSFILHCFPVLWGFNKLLHDSSILVLDKVLVWKSVINTNT